LATVKNKTNIYCVRTQLDICDDDADLERALQVDRDLLKQWDCPIPVFATSVKKGLDFKDNGLVKTMMNE